jgi:hypothetical protein
MDIEDLEFIRDFSDDLAYLDRSITSIFLAFEDNYDDGTVNEEMTRGALTALQYQSILVEKELSKFKKMIDRKYKDVWKEAYPEMQDIEDE